MNLNINNTNSGGKLNLNTKELKIRQDSGNTIKSPIDGRIIDINKDSCEGKVVISFESGQDKYTLEICGVGRIRTNVGSKITTGYPIGVSKGDALRIKVMNHRNESVKLSEFEKDNNKSNGNSSDDRFGLLDLMINSLYEPFKGSSGKKEKIKEDIQRIKKLL